MNFWMSPAGMPGESKVGRRAWASVPGYVCVCMYVVMVVCNSIPALR